MLSRVCQIFTISQPTQNRPILARHPVRDIWAGIQSLYLDQLCGRHIHDSRSYLCVPQQHLSCGNIIRSLLLSSSERSWLPRKLAPTRSQPRHKPLTFSLAKSTYPSIAMTPNSWAVSIRPLWLPIETLSSTIRPSPTSISTITLPSPLML